MIHNQSSTRSVSVINYPTGTDNISLVSVTSLNNLVPHLKNIVTQIAKYKNTHFWPTFARPIQAKGNMHNFTIQQQTYLWDVPFGVVMNVGPVHIIFPFIFYFFFM